MADDIVEITSSDQLDEYYKKVNDAIDEYFDKYKVRPGSLKRYLKPEGKGIKLFIERNKLSNVKNIEKVILDVVNDRIGMVEDGVLTFEHFKLHEKDLPLGVYDRENISNQAHKIQSEPDFQMHSNRTNRGSELSRGWVNALFPDIKKLDAPVAYKKIIADYYRTSLGHISDYELREFSLDNKEVFILNKEDIETITNTIVRESYEEISDMTFDDLVLDIYVTDIGLNDLIDKSVWETNLKSKLTLEKVIEVVTDMVEGEDYSPKGEFKGYYLWER